MSTSEKTRGKGPVIVNQRCDQASLSKASIASEGSSVLNLRLSALNCHFLCFDTLMNSFVLDKTLTQMFSPFSTLFTQNNGGMGRRLRSFTSVTSSTSFASYSSRPAARNFRSE